MASLLASASVFLKAALTHLQLHFFIIKDTGKPPIAGFLYFQGSLKTTVTHFLFRKIP